MARSGTTLLEKLLTNHRKMDVLSQPLPLIFIEAKRRFLKEKGVDRYYVLNDDLISRDYPQDEFDTYLDNFEIDLSDIDNIFNIMETYSGQYTKRDYHLSMKPHLLHGYKEAIKRCLESYKVDEDATYLGIKETMCEEFLPYLCSNDYKAIAIIRDPRDVLASANYPKKVKHLGSKKPALFIIKTWRKSAEYIHQLRNNINFHYLRYEDLVNHPYHELDKITDFLGIDKFSPTCFDKGILDRSGQPWMANTSFEQGENFISNRSTGIYKNLLSQTEISYTEAICAREMKHLNYQAEISSNACEIIKNYKDIDVQDSEDLKAGFSSRKDNIAQELLRFKSVK